jgi:hypothetical protein
MATGKITVDEGTATNLATNTITEDALTKHLQRAVPSTSAGAEILPALDASVGALTETAPATDTASSGLNGRLQRIAQRITSLIALVPAALDGSGYFKVHEQGTATVSGTVTANAGTNLNTSALATEATLDARTGALTETAPATDTASSGLNGRLQRIAQRLTTLLAVFPTTIDVNSGNKSASTLRVVIATDQPALTNKLLVTPDSVALPANQSVNVAQVNGVTPLMGAGNAGTGSPRVTIATDQVVIPVTVTPPTSGGLAVLNATSSDGATALTATAQVIKASAGQVFGWFIYNPNTSAVFVQFYNTAAASVTVGTTNPLFMITIPPLAAANVLGESGIAFSNAGFSCAATSTAGGAGAPTTALDANIFYK